MPYFLPTLMGSYTAKSLTIFLIIKYENNQNNVILIKPFRINTKNSFKLKTTTMVFHDLVLFGMHYQHFPYTIKWIVNVWVDYYLLSL